MKVTGVRNGIDNPANGGLIHMTRARHILMQVSQLTPEASVVSRLTDIRNKIISGKEDFQTMARLHSVDPSSTRGGELGWLQPGETVPSLTRVGIKRSRVRFLSRSSRASAIT